MKNNKILVIDDEKDFGILMQSFFKPKNYQVFVAYTITEGLKMLEELKPEVIFLDNILPDGFGWGKTKFILGNYPLSQLNLISAMEVPKTSTSSFRIIYKPLLREELTKMFGK